MTDISKNPTLSAQMDYTLRSANWNPYPHNTAAFIEYENAYNTMANRPSNKLELVEEMQA